MSRSTDRGRAETAPAATRRVSPTAGRFPLNRKRPTATPAPPRREAA
ncbi:hypothetical protein AB0K52_24715 [Glycomyces sp. NPDC049804]